jgi:hypothetical protein
MQITTSDNWTEVRASSGGRLTLHCGAALVPWETVEAVSTPPPTKTHYPLAHDKVVRIASDALAGLGWSVVDSAHALWGDGGLRYFGLLELEHQQYQTDGSYRFVLGIRNSHDKSYPAAGIGGERAWLCDNLVLAGGGVFGFARKHTRFAEEELPHIVNERLGELGTKQIAMQTRIDRYREVEVDDTMARDFMMRAAVAGGLPWSTLRDTWTEWARPDGCGGITERDGDGAPWGAVQHLGVDFHDPTLAKLLNCVTEVQRERRSSLLQVPRRNNRVMALLDDVAGLQPEFNADVANAALANA